MSTGEQALDRLEQRSGNKSVELAPPKQHDDMEVDEVSSFTGVQEDRQAALGSRAADDGNSTSIHPVSRQDSVSADESLSRQKEDDIVANGDQPSEIGECEDSVSRDTIEAGVDSISSEQANEKSDQNLSNHIDYYGSYGNNADNVTRAESGFREQAAEKNENRAEMHSQQYAGQPEDQAKNQVEATYEKQNEEIAEDQAEEPDSDKQYEVQGEEQDEVEDQFEKHHEEKAEQQQASGEQLSSRKSADFISECASDVPASHERSPEMVDDSTFHDNAEEIINSSEKPPNEVLVENDSEHRDVADADAEISKLMIRENSQMDAMIDHSLHDHELENKTKTEGSEPLLQNELSTVNGDSAFHEEDIDHLKTEVLLPVESTAPNVNASESEKDQQRASVGSSASAEDSKEDCVEYDVEETTGADKTKSAAEGVAASSSMDADDFMELDSVTAEERELWMHAEGRAADSRDAFRRGAYCLKSNLIEPALYWLNQSLEGEDIPECDEDDELENVPRPDIDPEKEEPATIADYKADEVLVEVKEDLKDVDEYSDAGNVPMHLETSPQADSTAVGEEPETLDQAQTEQVNQAQEEQMDRTQEVQMDESQEEQMERTQEMKMDETQEVKMDETQEEQADRTQEKQMDHSQEEHMDQSPKEQEQTHAAPVPPVREDSELSKKLMFRARALQLSGQHAAAVRDFTSSLRLAPDTDSARKCGAFVLRAKSFRESGRPYRALKDYQMAASLDPNQVTVYIGRSALYMSMQKHGEALEDCMRALDLDPRNLVAHRRSGLIFAETQRLPQAIRAFNRALAIRADYESLTLRGRSYVQLAEFDKALADYSLAISLNPDVALAYGHRSVLYAHLKRLDLAINDASSFINLSPTDACLSAYQNRGVWWAQMGEYDRAISDFDYVIKQQPTNSFAYMSRGTAYAQLKRYADSIADWLKVAQLHPNMVKAYYNLGKQYANSGDFEHAAHYFANVTRLMPNSVAGYQERAKALAAAGKMNEALEAWGQALEHDKNNPGLHEGRALTLLELDQADESMKALSQAIELNPADPTNYERRAAIAFKRGQLQEGRGDLLTAKKLRWTMAEEKRCYDEMIANSHAAQLPHMAVVRAAKAASSAALSK